MAKRVRLTPLDGIGRVGGSIWHIQQGSKGLLVDFGANLQRGGQFLGRGLRARDSHGIGDHLKLGLLPRVEGIYRPDLMLDGKVLEDALDLDVSDLPLTHAHADHGGNLWALAPEIRVHCSGVTAAMLHSHAVCSSGLASETTHLVERTEHPEEAGILVRSKGTEPTPRPVLLTDGAPTAELREAWSREGGTDGLGRSDLVAGGIPFEGHAVDHSLWGTTAFRFHTDAGEIVHLADLRCHGLEEGLTESLVRKLVRSRPRVLIVEGTRLGREDDTPSSEADCLRKATAVVGGAGKRLVIASVSPRNLERLAIFLHAAREARRALVVPARTYYLLEVVMAADSYYGLASLDGLMVYDPPLARREAWHRDLRERNSARLVGPEEIRRKPQRYVLTHQFGRTTDWLDVEPRGALLVHSSGRGYSDEDRGRQAALAAWIESYDMRVVGASFGKGGRMECESSLNPSGHLHPRDLKRMLARIRPEIVIPVHTTDPRAMEALVPEGTRVILPEDGKAIRL